MIEPHKTRPITPRMARQTQKGLWETLTTSLLKVPFIIAGAIMAVAAAVGGTVIFLGLMMVVLIVFVTVVLPFLLKARKEMKTMMQDVEAQMGRHAGTPFTRQHPQAGEGITQCPECGQRLDTGFFDRTNHVSHQAYCASCKTFWSVEKNT